MLTTDFLDWFDSLPVVGLPADMRHRSDRRSLAGFIRDQQNIESGLMNAWTQLTILCLFIAIGIGSVVGAIVGGNANRVAFDLCFFLPTFTASGLVLHGVRYELLYTVVRRARLRARTRGDRRWEDDLWAYQPHGFFAWLVTSHDGDFVFQGVVALVAVVIKVAVGP